MELLSKEQPLIEPCEVAGRPFLFDCSLKETDGVSIHREGPADGTSQDASGSSGRIRVTEDPSDGIRRKAEGGRRGFGLLGVSTCTLFKASKPIFMVFGWFVKILT